MWKNWQQSTVFGLVWYFRPPCLKISATYIYAAIYLRSYHFSQILSCYTCWLTNFILTAKFFLRWYKRSISNDTCGYKCRFSSFFASTSIYIVGYGKLFMNFPDMHFEKENYFEAWLISAQRTKYVSISSDSNTSHSVNIISNCVSFGNIIKNPKREAQLYPCKKK